ncbi:MAG: ABC transporter substrate-binding protein, partial [Chlorobiales bacterium]|nr:ABC transporter substrate-binding protein [Chlorobiales bacterium]
PGLTDAIAVRNQGKPIVVISGFSKWAVTVVAHKDLGLTSFTQLKGRKVGLIKGTNADLSFLGMLEKYKLSYSEQPGADIQIVYYKSYPALSAALLTKNVDAAGFTDPYGTQAVFRGYGTKLQPGNTPLGQPMSPLVTTEKFYDENQALIVRVLKCLTEANKIFQTQPDVAETFVTKTMFGGFLTPREYREMATNGSYTTDMTLDHVQTTIDMMNRYAMVQLDSKTPLKAASFVNLDLLRKAKETK